MAEHTVRCHLLQEAAHLTTECMITEVPEKEKAPSMPPGGGGMGDIGDPEPLSSTQIISTSTREDSLRFRAGD